MPGQKFLTLDPATGYHAERRAQQASAGADDGGKVLALADNGRLDPSVLPTGVGADVATVQASEAVAAGDFVNLHNVTGAARVRKADASNGREAHGFVLTGAASGSNATVYFEGRNTSAAAQTVGNVFLSATTAGAATSTPPSSGGQIVQRLGVAVSATEINTEIDQPTLLAA